MIRREPNNEILKAYYSLLNGTITLNGSPVTVGSKIPRRESTYIYFYVEDVEDYHRTTEEALFRVTVGIEIVTRQNVADGSEEDSNEILEQVLERVDDSDSFIMSNFTCSMTNYGGLEPDTDQDDKNYSVIKKLRMLHIIEQTS